MAITYELVKTVTAQLYDRSLRGIPQDTRAALERADAAESNETARHTLRIMLKSADTARASSQFICSDAGVPVYFVKIGTQAQFSGNVRQAITDGFAIRLGQPDCCVKQFLDPGPVSAGHAAPLPLSSRRSHALARRHSRFAVPDDTPSTSAASSIVSPPKNLSSMRRT